MEYQFLTEAEQHDILVQYAIAQEHDHYCHTVNRERVRAIIEDPATTPAYREQLRKFLADTEARLHEVTHLLEKTRAQLPDAEKVAAATARLAQRVALVPPPR